MFAPLLAFSPMTRLWPWLLAVLSGVCMALAFPPFGLDGLAWFAMVPLACAVWFSPAEGRRRWLRLLGLGYAAGLAFFLIAFSWLIEVTGPGWFVLCLYLALYPALWALFAGTVGRPREDGGPRSIWTNSLNNLRLAARSAAAWVGLEWVRGTLFSGFGWNQMGVSQWKNVAIIQIADFSGIGGVTFLVVLVNLMVVMTAKRLSLEVGRGRLRPHYDFVVTLGLLAAAFLYGQRYFLPGAFGPETPLRISAVQANIPQDHKWNADFEQEIMATYKRLSEGAAALQPDLLVWPEAALPRPLLQDELMQMETGRILAELNGYFLLGTLNFSPGVGAFNAAVLLSPKGNYELYHKMHLVPFGEFVPFRHSFPLFAWIVGDQVSGDFDAGDTPVVMTMSARPVRLAPVTEVFAPGVSPALFPTLPASVSWSSLDVLGVPANASTGLSVMVEGDPVKIAPLICFEDTVGELVRRFAAGGAELLITITNDGWFRESAGSHQHLANAVFSAVETKLPLVRAANTGVTCFVDRRGVVRDQLQSPGGSTFIQGVLTGEVPVPVHPPKTIYTRYGDLFSLACLLLALLSIRTHFVVVSRPRVTESRSAEIAP